MLCDALTLVERRFINKNLRFQWYAWPTTMRVKLHNALQRSDSWEILDWWPDDLMLGYRMRSLSKADCFVPHAIRACAVFCLLMKSNCVWLPFECRIRCKDMNNWDSKFKSINIRTKMSVIVDFCCSINSLIVVITTSCRLKRQTWYNFCELYKALT